MQMFALSRVPLQLASHYQLCRASPMMHMPQ